MQEDDDPLSVQVLAQLDQTLHDHDVLRGCQHLLGEFAAGERARQQKHRDRKPPSDGHQKVTSTPNVGSSGNIDTPERTAGSRSYSKK